MTQATNKQRDGGLNVKNKTLIAISKVNKAITEVQNKPPLETDKLSLRGAIKKMHPNIIGMKDKGYDWKEIVETLKANGIEIKLSTLRTYIYGLNGEVKAAKKTKAEDNPVRTDHDG